MTSSRLIPNFFDTSQASLSNATASSDGNKSEISPNTIPSILALPAILPANVVAFPVLNAFPDFPPGFGAAALGLAVALGFGAVASGLTSGFGVVPSNFGVASYFHPSHLAVDPAGADGGAAGGAVTVLAISPALAFTLKVRAGAEGAAAPVPAFAFALKAAGGGGGATAAVGAVADTTGAEVLLNKLDAFEVYSLTFSLNGTLLKYSLALVPKFLNIEGFGALVVALAALAALSLSALYSAYFFVP